MTFLINAETLCIYHIFRTQTKFYREAVIRYSRNSGVVPYFSEILPLYLIDTHFPKNSQNPVPYRHLLAVPYNGPLYLRWYLLLSCTSEEYFKIQVFLEIQFCQNLSL